MIQSRNLCMGRHEESRTEPDERIGRNSEGGIEALESVIKYYGHLYDNLYIS